MSISRKLKRLHKNNRQDIDSLYSFEAMRITEQWNHLDPIPYEWYKQFSPEAWNLACQLQGVHQIITEELVEFINHLIGKSMSIEICCGCGTLGRALRIPRIDRKVSEDKRVKDYIKVHEQVGVQSNIIYPCDVITMTANDAFKFYNPEWVIGCWVTQKLKGGKNGMMLGPREEEFVKNANYIHVGASHLKIHTHKRINKIPHYIIEADWLVHKSSMAGSSQMRIWTNKELNFDEFPDNLEFIYTNKN